MTQTDLRIRTAVLSDLPRLTEIYNQGVEDGVATCELSGFSPEERVGWFEEHQGPYRIWVAERLGTVVGWTSLSQYDRKPCFYRTGTIATYVERQCRRLNVGSALRAHLIAEAKRLGFHSVLSRVWVTNVQSRRLAEKFGFTQIGYLPELVFINGKYVDCLLFQKMLD